MKKLLAALFAALCFTSPALASDPEIKTWKTYHSLGCMLLKECTDGVDRIRSSSDLAGHFTTFEDKGTRAEFDELVLALNMSGVGVYIADEKYFPDGTRGSYHTPTNNFFLNKYYAQYPHVAITVIRHEGWHAAQDCMAGTIDNTMLAIIHNEEDIPGVWRAIAASTYDKSPLPWEQEALWAGHTPHMTVKALNACARGRMWEAYTPTPMTEEWLIDNGYIKSKG